MKRFILATAVLCALICLPTLAVEPVTQAVAPRFLWVDGALCVYAQAIGRLTGGFDVDCVPYLEFKDLAFTSMRGSDPDITPYDVVMMDYRYLAQAVEEDLVEELTDMMNDASTRSKDFFPKALQAFSEFPINSGRYFAFPFQGDTQYIAYRPSVFKKYDHPIPTDLQDFVTTAEFFFQQREMQYGLSYAWCTTTCRDDIMVLWRPFLYMYGGDIWDEKSYTFTGYADSPIAVEALNLVRRLFKTGPERIDYSQQAIDDFCSGRSAMFMTWVSEGPVHQLPGCSGVNASEIEYIAIPFNSLTSLHKTALGGWSSVVPKNAPNKDEAFAMAKMLSTNTHQQTMSNAGLLTVRRSIALSQSFLMDDNGDLLPLKAVFLQGFQQGEPRYRLGITDEMDQILFHNVLSALTNTIDTKAALSNMTASMQKLVNEVYPCGPTCIQPVPARSFNWIVIGWAIAMFGTWAGVTFSHEGAALLAQKNSAMGFAITYMGAIFSALCAFWAQAVLGVTSISFAGLPVRYDYVHIIIALIPALGGPFLALIVYLTAKSQAQTTDDLEETEFRLLSAKGKAKLLLQRLASGPLWLASALYTVGLFVPSIMAATSIHSHFSIELDAGGVIAALVVSMLGTTCSLLAFEAKQFIIRVLGPMMLVVCSFLSTLIIVDTLRYTPGNPFVPLDDGFEGGDLNLGIAIMGGVVAFLCLAININRMKLSRNSLTAMLDGTKKEMAQMEASIGQEKETTRLVLSERKKLANCLELINIARPLTSNQAVAMAMAPIRSFELGLPKNEPKPLAPALALSAHHQRHYMHLHVLQQQQQQQQQMEQDELEAAIQAGIPLTPIPLFSENAILELLTKLEGPVNIQTGPHLYLLGEQITLDDVLQHPVSLELFKDYVKEQRCPEVLAMYLEIMRYQRLIQKEVRLRVATAIIDTFLKSFSPHPVKVSDEQRHACERNVRSASMNLFDGVLEELRNTLLSIHWKGFTETSHFKFCAVVLGHPKYALLTSQQEAQLRKRRANGGVGGTTSGTGSAGTYGSSNNSNKTPTGSKNNTHTRRGQTNNPSAVTSNPHNNIVSSIGPVSASAHTMTMTLAPSLKDKEGKDNGAKDGDKVTPLNGVGMGAVGLNRLGAASPVGRGGPGSVSGVQMTTPVQNRERNRKLFEDEERKGHVTINVPGGL